MDIRWGPLQYKHNFGVAKMDLSQKTTHQRQSRGGLRSVAGKDTLIGNMSISTPFSPSIETSLAMHELADGIPVFT